MQDSASSSLGSKFYSISLEIIILLWNSRKEIPLLPPALSKKFCSMAPKHCRIWKGGRSANCTTYAFEICSERFLMPFFQIFLATQVHFSDSDGTKHIFFLWNTASLINIIFFSTIASVRRFKVWNRQLSLFFWTVCTQEDLRLSASRSLSLKQVPEEGRTFLLNKTQIRKLISALPETPFKICAPFINFSHLLYQTTHPRFP